MKSITPALLLSGLVVSQAGAAILLDFGPTSPATGTNNLTNSPFHTATGSMDTTWNVLGTADQLTGVMNSDGTAASVGVNIGATAASSTVIDLANQPGSSNGLGTQIMTGVYRAGSIGRDAIFDGTNPSVHNVGFQLTGLAAGSYDVYLTMRNTNDFNIHSMTGFVAAGTASPTFDHSGYSSVTLTYGQGAGAQTAAWVPNGMTDANYALFNVTLTAGQVLNVAVAGDGAGGPQTRGFLSSAAIVAVPEPSTSLLGLAGFSLAILRRRR